MKKRAEKVDIRNNIIINKNNKRNKKSQLCQVYTILIK